jgi:Sec-independent protein translocase protein TatA
MIPDWELMFLALVALLLFGDKLPSMMRKVGQGLSEFIRAMEQSREQVRKGVEEPDRSNRNHPSSE